ncbi:two-component system, sensor histidine kinase YesM [Paenibacillus sp. UNCCL117]|uniref:sensor histidine kinase n=1 Tax=unclassified Paenibacillus TaxID=185978 RepID=UPI000880FCDF|nr:MULTISPECIES: sensor histidine kinase [unclassified Paenibacillus]SDD04296.1 two-component system, sensor histidine kinase YesM [Paenibacillus sp. cl123]SFW32114.1 two-component system, sensor histidine kinase YesM [Paenibacillus sp. UNCCL117]
MRILRHFHYRFSIKTKLTVAFLLVGMLTILLMGMLSYHLYNNGIKRDFHRISQEATLRLNHHIDFYIYQLTKSTSSVAKDELVQKWMKYEHQATLEEQQNVQNVLRRHVALNYPEIVGMFLLTPDGRTLSMTNLALRSEELLAQEPWYDNRLTEKAAVISTHAVKYVNEDVRVLSLEMPIYSVENMDLLGKLVIDFHLDEIQRTFEKSSLAPQGRFFIVSEQDRIVYYPNYKWLGLPREQTALQQLDLTDNENASIQQWESKRTLVAVTRSETTGWTFVSIVPYEEMASAAKHTPNTMIFAFIVIACCIVTVVPFLSRAFVKPILHLRQVMGSVERGDLQVRAAYTSGHDEFQYLNRSFNMMIEQVNQLLETVSTLKLQEVSLQLREKEALVKALQTQINPHFLYNSLDIIKSMAYLEDMPEIVKMARSLADFYRYTAQDMSAIVRLEEELTQLKHFLSIIHIRFPGTFRSQFSVNEKFMHCLIPKLIVQPLVENAVKYAIEAKEGKGSIIINAFDDQSDLVIEVADNGPGIRRERLEQIQAMLKQLSENALHEYGKQQSLGIANVHARIVLQYGSAYGLSLDSFEGRGTVASLRLPLHLIQNKTEGED